MKLLNSVLLSIIAALVWNSNDARTFIADKLEESAEFIRPETQQSFTFSF